MKIMCPRVHQEDPAKLKATVTQASAERTISGTVEVVQDTAADLTATVTQAAKDRTITGTVEVVQDTPADLKATITPSGDMAREHYYDRNAGAVVTSYEASLGNHAKTQRYSYTVPANHNAMHNVGVAYVDEAIGTATKKASWSLEVSVDAGSNFDRYVFMQHHDGSGFVTQQTTTITFALKATDICRGYTYSNDTVNHYFLATIVVTEYDT